MIGAAPAGKRLLPLKPTHLPCLDLPRGSRPLTGLGRLIGAREHSSRSPGRHRPFLADRAAASAASYRAMSEGAAGRIAVDRGHPGLEQAKVQVVVAQKERAQEPSGAVDAVDLHLASQE